MDKLSDKRAKYAKGIINEIETQLDHLKEVVDGTWNGKVCEIKISPQSKSIRGGHSRFNKW